MAPLMRDRPDVFRARQADHLRGRLHGLQRGGDPQQLLHALQQLTPPRVFSAVKLYFVQIYLNIMSLSAIDYRLNL